MAEGKRYYWLKLKDDFFDSLRIKKLRKIAGGDTYTIIYLKMQLKAIKRGGMLTYKGIENDFASELALDIDEDTDDVRVTLQYLMSCGLCECSDNINFFLPYAAENTKSEGASARRMRDHRAKEASLSDTNVTTPLQISDGEIDIEIEKDIEIDIDIEGERKDNAPAREKYGQLQNVILTSSEYVELTARFGGRNRDEYIRRLDLWIAKTGKNFSSHYAAILDWFYKDHPKDVKTGSFETSEFFDAAVKKSYAGR